MTGEQGDLFGARGARDEGFDRIEVHGGDWMMRAMRLIRTRVYGTMTGEELRLQLLRLGLEPPHHHNAWGALINTAIRARLLAKTGAYAQMRTTRSHARSTPVLRRIA